MSRFFRTAVLLSALFCPWVARAVQSCEIDSQSVNPNNGNTTVGKTGLMRCRESEGGPVLRDETLRNGTTIGVARTWLASGTLKRVSFHGDDGREQAVAEFTPQAKLADLRCGTQPLLAPEADDATWCGHRGKGPVTVELYSNNGAVRGRLTQERGERRKVETLRDSGKLREETVIDASGGSERHFSAEGVKRRERVWVTQVADGRSARITTLEQEFHKSGTLVRERRWLPSERGGELQREQHWTLNGQLRDKIDYLQHEGQSARRETRHHDNGRASTEGLWLVKGRYDDQATGTHKGFDDQGRLRSERFYDARAASPESVSSTKPGACCRTKSCSKTARARLSRAEALAQYPRFPVGFLGAQP